MLPNAEAYIAPQLLSPTRPAYEWEGRGGLVLQYDYEFMPKGILTRFIVAVNHLIADQGLVWKSGVILERKARGPRSSKIIRGGGSPFESAAWMRGVCWQL